MISFDHINIQADNQEIVRDFLVAVLGLEVGFRPPFDVPGYWLYLGDKAVVHMQGRTGAAASGAHWVDHVAFGTFVFEEKVAELDTGGFDYFVGGIPGTGIRQIFVHGPEGLKIELQCREVAAGQ